MINITENGKAGRLYNRFRYLRTLENRKNIAANQNQISQHSEEQQYSMEDMLYLKTVVVSADTIDEIRKKLESTRQQRDALVKNVEIDLMIKFPFFFTYPQLVSYSTILLIEPYSYLIIVTFFMI